MLRECLREHLCQRAAKERGGLGIACQQRTYVSVLSTPGVPIQQIDGFRQEIRVMKRQGSRRILAVAGLFISTLPETYSAVAMGTGGSVGGKMQQFDVRITSAGLEREGVWSRRPRRRRIKYAVSTQDSTGSNAPDDFARGTGWGTA